MATECIDVFSASCLCVSGIIIQHLRDTLSASIMKVGVCMCVCAHACVCVFCLCLSCHINPDHGDRDNLWNGLQCLMTQLIILEDFIALSNIIFDPMRTECPSPFIALSFMMPTLLFLVRSECKGVIVFHPVWYF